MPTEQEWIRDAVRFYRRLDFFQEYARLSDEELAVTLAEQFKEKWGEPIDFADEWDAATILVLDDSRVYIQDLEVDVSAQDNVYKHVLDRFADISRGAFAPKNITETWESQQGPIQVDFTLNDVPYRFEPEYQEKRTDIETYSFFDAKIYSFFEALLRPTGYHLAYFFTEGENAICVVLTPEEKRQIERERGLELFFDEDE